MSTHRTTRRTARAVLVVTAAAAMVSCGGGGDDGGLGPIDLTVANRDTVAHAAAAAVLAMSPAGALPVAGSGQLAVDQRLLAAGVARRSLADSRLLARVLDRARTPALAGDSQRRALAVSGPVTEACPAGGTLSVTFDDRNNDLTVSAGDVLSLAFANCRMSPEEVFNGTAVATYTRVSTFPTIAVGASLTMTQLSMAESQHSIRLNGTALMDFRQSGPGLEVTRLTAEGSVSAAITTHVFADTVTMRHGFWFESVYDPAAAPPPGGSQPGRSTSTLQGEVESSLAGGVLSVSAMATAPIVDYDADPYPRSGVVTVTSGKGRLLLTALSPEQVRIDLDADDNAVFESSTTVSWDWLI